MNLNNLLPTFNPKQLTDNKIILVGVVGSHAYGLATKDSDVDLRGIFLTPTISLLGLDVPTPHIVANKPYDHTLYELLKYCNEALKCNPNTLDLLYLNDYLILDEWGQQLIELRECFLSERARDAYIGYAKSQLRKMHNDKTSKKLSKHARHSLRLLQQGTQLITTGKLNVVVEEPDYIFWVGEQEFYKMARILLDEIEKLKRLDSVLPEAPDRERVNEYLITVRKNH